MPPRKPSLSVVGSEKEPAGTRKAAAAKTAAAPKAMSVKEAAGGGDRRELLVAMRSRIAGDIDNRNTPPRDVAALSRRLLEIAREIEAIDAETKVNDVGAAAATPDEEWTAT